LLAVQEHDTALDQLHHRRETLPERATRHDLLVRGQSVANERAEVAKERDVVAGRQSELEAELATSEERMRQLDKRLYSGEVSAARDLQAMADEIERLKEYCSGIEDRILSTLDEREPLDARVDELDAQLKGFAEEIHHLERAIAVAEEEIDTEIAAEEQTRAGLATGIRPELLSRYDALRKKLGGEGAALLKGHSCGGCHLALPAQEIDRIKHAPPDELIFCDQCGRILVRPD
jgi:predicted  nucleic acid-binding Zn-ribbon protein